MSGSPMIMTGKKAGKITTMMGEGPGPSGVAKYKTVTDQESNDKMIFQMYTVSDGKDNEVMTVTYTRKGK